MLAEILKIMGFWLQLGVSGFRMNAVPFVIAKKAAEQRRPVEQDHMLCRFREFLQWRVGDAIILAEANVLPKSDMEYFGGDGDRMHMMFNFQVTRICSMHWRSPTIARWSRPWKQPALGRPLLNGVFLATMTSSILVACPPDKGQQFLLPWS